MFQECSSARSGSRGSERAAASVYLGMDYRSLVYRVVNSLFFFSLSRHRKTNRRLDCSRLAEGDRGKKKKERKKRNRIKGQKERGEKEKREMVCVARTSNDIGRPFLSAIGHLFAPALGTPVVTRDPGMLDSRGTISSRLVLSCLAREHARDTTWDARRSL